MSLKKLFKYFDRTAFQKHLDNEFTKEISEEFESESNSQGCSKNHSLSDSIELTKGKSVESTKIPNIKLVSETHGEVKPINVVFLMEDENIIKYIIKEMKAYEKSYKLECNQGLDSCNVNKHNLFVTLAASRLISDPLDSKLDELAQKYSSGHMLVLKNPQTPKIPEGVIQNLKKSIKIYTHVFNIDLKSSNPPKNLENPAKTIRDVLNNFK